MKTLELSPLQNAILVRVGTAERLTTDKLVHAITSRFQAQTDADKRELEHDVHLQINLLSLHGLIQLSNRHGGRQVCIASQRVREWLPDHLKRAQTEGPMHRPSIALPIIMAATLTASGCTALGNIFTQNEPAPVVARYDADRTMLQERMEQFRDARGNMVYRYCIGNECPQPTPKMPVERKLPVVIETAEDGTILPTEPPASIPVRSTSQPPQKTASGASLETTHRAGQKPTSKARQRAAEPVTKAVPAASTAKIEEPRPAPSSAQTPSAQTPPAGNAKAAPAATNQIPVVQNEEVADFVSKWASLWSDKNVEDYFALYSDSYKPANGMRSKDWMASRASIMKRSHTIDVSIQNLDVTETDGVAIATFIQKYDSPRFKSVIFKRLALTKENEGWKIAYEVVLPVGNTVS